MTKDELKPQVEEMLYQTLKLAQQLDKKEAYELKIELACSCITAAIDFDLDKPIQTISNLKKALNETVDIAIDGTTRTLFEKGMYKLL